MLRFLRRVMSWLVGGPGRGAASPGQWRPGRKPVEPSEFDVFSTPDPWAQEAESSRPERRRRIDHCSTPLPRPLEELSQEGAERAEEAAGRTRQVEEGRQ